ncbi:thioesterase family protein [Clostridium sp. JN-1]|uniref:thioesterase family protein n=1 Tax=Clostridium sp. JN-1 TaxID=2483110 RepID=UPI000F0BB9FC|nr:thioesterase family protein [Clostridium sp. JN-1]
MEFNLKEGMTSAKEMKVTENDLASKMGSGVLDVFATPAMIALMEETSRSCVDLHLPCGYTTVGIELNVKHLKSTPIGMKVRCEAILTKVDNKELTFKVEVWDEKDKVGEGKHSRYIVNSDRFMEKTNNKKNL